MEESNDFSVVDFFADHQCLRKLPFLSNRWKRMKDATEDVKDFIRRQVRDRFVDS